jgi:predicted GTPase
VNDLRETLGLIGVPIRLSMRSSGENPYAPKKRPGE